MVVSLGMRILDISLGLTLEKVCLGALNVGLRGLSNVRLGNDLILSHSLLGSVHVVFFVFLWQKDLLTRKILLFWGHEGQIEIQVLLVFVLTLLHGLLYFLDISSLLSYFRVSLSVHIHKILGINAHLLHSLVAHVSDLLLIYVLLFGLVEEVKLVIHLLFKLLCNKVIKS